jgi:hypothetical protein
MRHISGIQTRRVPAEKNHSLTNERIADDVMKFVGIVFIARLMEIANLSVPVSLLSVGRFQDVRKLSTLFRSVA